MFWKRPESIGGGGKMKKTENMHMTADDRNLIGRYLGADNKNIREADILKIIAGDSPVSDDMLVLAAAYELGRRVRDGYA
jgi:hypothetical protein